MSLPVSLRRLETLTKRLRQAVYPDHRELRVEAWDCPGEPVPIDEALRQDFRPFKVGEAWGHRWGTTWFRGAFTCPEEWDGKTVVAEVAFDFTGMEGFTVEALVIRNGVPAGALNVNRREIPLAEPSAAGEKYLFHLEAAANPRVNQPDLPQSQDSSLLPDPGGPPLARLKRARACVRDERAYQFWLDFVAALDLARVQPATRPRRRRILRELTRAANAWELDGEDSKRAGYIVRGLLASPAAASHVAVHAVGHAHIDTAWLWPLRETIRKCARTFSTQLALMDKYPNFHFSCSQPVQYLWMRAFYPTIWEGIHRKIASRQWEPIGSMWVEPDCNLTGGESLLRQILHGKRFFREFLGVETKDLWLPDVFGYPASLPQLLHHCDIRAFFTQKLSWNETNAFPFHSFRWEGIDGTRVLTHFAPADTYNGEATASEIQQSESAYRQNDVSDEALYPFGFGDGGGGPTAEQIELLQRFSNCEGLPPVRLSRVDRFFEALTASEQDLPVWVGELYLELHRGTYTTQARLKRANRANEFRLRRTECLLAHLQLDSSAWETAGANLLAGEEVPRALYDIFGQEESDPLRARLTRAWQLLLLNQFHDILPGSSIHWVYEDAQRDEEVIAELTRSLDQAAVKALSSQASTADPAKAFLVCNPLGRAREEWVTLPDGASGFARVPPTGWSILQASDLRIQSADTVEAHETEEGAVLANQSLRVAIDHSGRVRSLFDRRQDREVLSRPEGNTFFLQVDRPPFWNAWDVEKETDDMSVTVTGPAAAWEVLEEGPLAGGVRFELRMARSVLRQEIWLRAESRLLEFVTEVDWQEQHRLLRVGFPFALPHATARYEIQWGHLSRPTHQNTSWDQARFECCAHKWVDLAEPTSGLALLNDGKYGHSVRDGWLRLSLLRSPSWPDGEADQGRHRFRYALLPHSGDFRAAGVINAAYAFNAPLEPISTVTPDAEREASLLAVECPALVLEALKPAEDRDGLVVRLYESWGTTGQGVLRWNRRPALVQPVDGLERPCGPPLGVDDDDGTHIAFRPFEILSLRVRFES